MQDMNGSGFGKKIYDNIHFNQQKGTYKVVEANLTDKGVILVLSEGTKGNKDSRKRVAIALGVPEILHLQKVLEEAATYLVRREFKK